MTATLEDRVRFLESQVALLADQLLARKPLRPSPEPIPAVVRVEPQRPVRPPQPAPAAAPVRPTASSRRSRHLLDLEELFGGRLLALVGGMAVVLGIAFLVALAIEQGWVGATARVVIAACGSAALLASGVWLYERRGKTQAALAVVGAAIAGLFLTLTAATVRYDMIPEAVALLSALGIGAVATSIAVRWNTRTVAALGIGGTLLAPVLGNALTTGGMAFLALAYASAAGVLLWRRWPWLAVGAFGLTLAQVAVWTVGGPQDLELAILLAAFAVLNLAAAFGYQLRDAIAGLEPSSALLVPFGALMLGALGYFGLPHGEGELAGGLWLVTLAGAHAILAGTALRRRAGSEEIGLVMLGTAVILGDVAFGFLANGWVLGVGWAASATGFAVIAHRYTGRGEPIQLTVGAQLALSIGHVLLFDAPPEQLVAGGAPGPEALAAVTAVGIAAFASARLVVEERREIRGALDALSMTALAYAAAVSFDGGALLVAWAGASVALAGAARRYEDRVVGIGALGFLALLGGHLLAFEAPPSSLVYGLDAPGAAAFGLALVAVTAFMCVHIEPMRTVAPRPALVSVAAVALLYLGSTAIVTAFQPGLGAIDTGLGVDIRQQGQALLSAFWSICGFTALWLGLSRNVRIVRLSGFGLLGLAAAKVFLYDLSTLGSVYRVVSFIALGLVLLTAAFAYQREGRS